MPKIPALTPKKIIKLLKQNGFVLNHSTGSHLIFYNPDIKRRVTVAFYSKDLPRGTLISILRQAGIDL